MAHSVKSMVAAGWPPLVARMLNGTVDDNLTATGTTQMTALVIAADVNVVTNVPSGSGVILLANSQPGDEIAIANLGANALTVYPQVGGSIQGGLTNAGFSLAVGTTATFAARPGGVGWTAISTAPGGVATNAPLFFGGWNNDYMAWYQFTSPEVELIGGSSIVDDTSVTIPDANRTAHGDILSLPAGRSSYAITPQLPADKAVQHELTWDEGGAAGSITGLAQFVFGNNLTTNIAARSIKFFYDYQQSDDSSSNGPIIRLTPAGGGKYATNFRVRPVGADPSAILNPAFQSSAGAIYFGGFMRSTHWTTVENFGSPTDPGADFSYPNLKFPQTGDGQLVVPSLTAANRNTNNADWSWHDGVPFERQLRIAGAAGAHFWFNAPWDTDGISSVGVLTSSTYHTTIAGLAAAWSLANGKLFGVEGSNEVWNPGYTVFHQCLNEAAALGITARQWYAKKSLWIWGHYEAAFNALGIGPANGANNKLVRILTAQNAGTTTAFPEMLDTTDGAGGTVGDHCEMLAVAPYADSGFASTYTGVRPPVHAATKTNIDAVLAQAAGHYSTAVARGKKFGFYECGYNNIFSDSTFRHAFWIDSEQYDNQLYFAQQIELKFPNIYVQWFNLSSPLTGNTGWGLEFHVSDTVSKATTPRLQAIKDLKNGVRVLSAAGGTLGPVALDAAIGDSVGTLTPSVAGSTWALTNNLGGKFAINATTGQVTVAASLAGLTLGTNSIQASEINAKDATGHFETTVNFTLTPALLRDNFNGGVLDGAKWVVDSTMISASAITATGVTASVASSELEINFGTTTANRGNAIRSVNNVDLSVNPSHFVKFTANGDNGHPRGIAFGTPGGLVYQIQRHDSALFLFSFNNDGGTQLATIGALSIASFPWARLRYVSSDDTIRVDTAPSTASNPPVAGDWTQQLSVARGALPLTGKIGLFAFENFGTAAGVIIGFDGFNTGT